MDHEPNPKSIALGRAPDLSLAIEAVRARRADPDELMARCLAVADGPQGQDVFIRRFHAQARAAARAATSASAAGAPLPPLAGLAISIKDLFDVAGHPTTAGSKAMHDAPLATSDCPAVARLRQAGAALVGHTNMSEFAFSGIGLNPHFGTPINPVTAELNPTPRIPGGSTSGGAVSVAIGAAWAALGSDTGGSLRIPAALQGLVGFKSTQRLVPLDGVLPLSTTLDTAGAITRSVRDAALLHGILADRRPQLEGRPLSAMRLAVPSAVMLEGLDAEVTRAFELALARLASTGAHVDTFDLPELGALGGLQHAANFPAAEAWAWHRARLATRENDYDPRVAQRIRRGEGMLAADYLDLVAARRAWSLAVAERLRGYDAALSPTVPMVAPPLAPLLNSEQRFFAINTLLLRNPSVVNMLDGCGLSLPCQEPGQMPVGLMVWAPALHDDRVLSVGLAIERALAPAFAERR